MPGQRFSWRNQSEPAFGTRPAHRSVIRAESERGIHVRNVSRVRLIAATACVALVCATTLAVLRIVQFKDGFVMITVEESSASAVTSWPLLAERLPGVFLDCENRSVFLKNPPSLIGTCLGVYYSAASQGIEIAESLTFSRTGRASVRLTEPLSLVVEGLEGEKVDIVDNRARVLSGDLKIRGGARDGTVRVSYGGREFSLKPGEAWAELLALTPYGVKRIGVEDWAREVEECVRSGYPLTRLAVANRGFWPKSGVKEGGQ